MTDREFDRLIERSVKEFGDSYGTIENEEPNHIFSQRFENNMKVLISRQKKTKVNRIIKISAGAAAVLVIGVGSIAVSRMFSDGGLYGVDNISMNRSIAAPDVVGKNEASANISVEDEEDDIAQNDDAENGNAYSFKNDIKQNDSFDTEKLLLPMSRHPIQRRMLHSLLSAKIKQGNQQIKPLPLMRIVLLHSRTA